MCVEHKKAMESKFPRISPAVLFFITCSTRPPTRCSWYLADRNQLWCTFEHSHVSMLFSHIRHIVGKRLTWWHLKHPAEHLMCWRRQWPDIQEKTKLRTISWILLTPEKPGRWFSRRPPFPWSISPCRLRSFFCKVCCQMGGNPPCNSLQSRRDRGACSCV